MKFLRFLKKIFKRKKKKKLYRSVTRWLSLVLMLTFSATVAATYYVLTAFIDSESYMTVKEKHLDVVYKMYDTAHEKFQSEAGDLNKQLEELPEDKQGDFISTLPSDQYCVCLTDDAGKVLYANSSSYRGKDLNELADLKEESLSYQKRRHFEDFDGTEVFIYSVKNNMGYLVLIVTTDHARQMVTDKISGEEFSERLGVFGYTIIMDSDKNVIGTVIGYVHEDDDDMCRLAEFYDTLPNIEETDGITVEGPDFPEKYSGLWGTIEIDGLDYYYCIRNQFSVYIVSILPVFEAYESVIYTIFFIILGEIFIFIMIFISMRVILWFTVAKKINAVNQSLGRITAGDLEEKVDVRSAREFNSLSDDINAMVDKLKGYISEAEARYDADLAVAKEIQQSSLPYVFPPFPERTEFALYATMTAAKEVGGDFYDFFMLGENTLGFLIADVSGKSIPGAMFMMRAKSVINSLAESGVPAAEVFEQANDSLCQNNEAEMFVTAWMGFLDLDTGLVHVANAGHNPPLLIHNGQAEYVNMKPGLMLGVMEEMPYEEQQLKLEPGDMLFLYTDGVTEAMNTTEQLYGEERLKNILSVTADVLPEDEHGAVGAICRRVADNVASFTMGAEQSDDITMLCLQYIGRNNDEKTEN